ncbi:MAG: hypothetical protein ACOYOS_21950, partial [Syntrophales bacterium]
MKKQGSNRRYSLPVIPPLSPFPKISAGAPAEIKYDDLVKSRKCPTAVIPVKTGIHKFQHVTQMLDTGFHRCD